MAEGTPFPLCSPALFAVCYCEGQRSPWAPAVLGVVGQKGIAGRRWAQLLALFQGWRCPIPRTVEEKGGL